MFECLPRAGTLNTKFKKSRFLFLRGNVRTELVNVGGFNPA